MCGICGFNFDDKQLIKKMADSIAHRGPDQDGFFTDKSVSLGHKRLSIIDLSEKGKQPIFNEENDICIVFNGEIYNFLELKKDLEKKGHKFYSETDTEVIVHSYEEYGVSCLEMFNGDFAFAIYDSRKKILFLARDRMGVKPLYYYFKDNKFFFASEIKAILEYDEIKREINLNSLNKYLTYRYISGEETIFQGINRIEAAHYVIYDLKTNKFKINKYWDIDISNKNILNKNEDYFKKRIREIFKDSVKKRLISDVPIGVYLSGGLDSSAIVAVINKINKNYKIKTFSTGFEHDEIGNEVKYAKQVSDEFNTDHKEMLIKSDVIKELPKIIWHLDEPMSDPAAIPNYFLSKEAKKKVTVILTGDGGDDIFAGYDQFKFPILGRKFRHIPDGIRKTALSLGVRLTPKKILNKIYKYSASTGDKMFERFEKFIYNINNESKSYLEIISIFDEEERKELINKKIIHKIDNFTDYERLNNTYFNNKNNYLNNLLNMEIKNYLAEDLLIKPDRMGMAHGVEIRVPFLDKRLTELSFQIPPSMKLKGMTTKYIFKKSMEGVVSKNIIYRKKQPFSVPLDNWIKKELSPLFHEYLCDKNIKKEGYFNPYYIKKMFDKYDKSPLFYGRQMYSLLNFEIWKNIYIEQEKNKFKI